MRATLLLAFALLGAAPADLPPRWIPFAPNPGWEIYGTEDESGRFRYTAMRQKEAEKPVLNLGVNLPPLTASSPPRDVMATDANSASLVYSAVDDVPVCGHSDCPNDRCDKDDREEVPDKDEVKINWLNPAPEHIAVIALVAVGCLILFLAVVIVVALLIKGIVHVISSFRRRE